MPGRLDDYVTVAERVSAASAQIQHVHADPPVMLTDVMGYIRVTVTLHGGDSATGTASFRLDLGGKSAQATNPIEDCETSAVGRALAFLGYETKRGIASREDVHEARRREQAQPASYEKPAPTLNDAMRKTYERASAHAGRVIENWAQLMTWVNRPVTTPQPTTIDGWRALYRLCDERATELAAEQEGIPA